MAVRELIAEDLLVSAPPATKPRKAESIHTIKYMGSKREIVDFVAPAIEQLLRPGERVLDVMAGTSSIAYSLRENHPVIANDIQHFSATIAKAVLQTRSTVPPSEVLLEKLDIHVRKNRAALSELFDEQLKVEQAFIDRRATEPFDESDLAAYREFFRSFPDPVAYTNNDDEPSDPLAAKLQSMVFARRNNSQLFPYILMTSYFATNSSGHNDVEISRVSMADF